MNKKGKKFEIVWVSQDRSTDDFQRYFYKMPWLAVPIQSIQTSLQIFSHPKYALKGIPHLVILDEDGSIITTDGRGMVARDKYGLEFPWRKRDLLSLVPRPVQKWFKREALKAVSVLRNVATGIASSLTPSRILVVIKERVYPAMSQLAKVLYKQIVAALASAKGEKG